MGVLFKCGNVDYSCAYSNWNIVRVEMINASFRYFENMLKINGDEMPPQNKKEYDTNAILKILGEKENMLGVDAFNSIIDEKYRVFINYYIYFDMGGLCALINKPDDSGLYSPGNSLDILILFNKLESFIENAQVKERLVSLKKLFENSVTEKIPVIIM
jgi:hypothetical protein